MIPRTIGLAAGQINLVVITMIASTLSSGSIAVFNFANNLQSLPVSLFAVSLAVAVFPTFTQAINENNNKQFINNNEIVSFINGQNYRGYEYDNKRQKQIDASNYWTNYFLPPQNEFTDRKKQIENYCKSIISNSEN